MPVSSLILWAVLVAQSQTSPLAPRYSAESLVNAASNTVGPLAPNTIATLYGANLSFETRAITPEDMRGNTLPTVLPQTGVRILINGTPAAIFYVSPTQVNFVVPSNLIPGTFRLELVRSALAGPVVRFAVAREAPQPFIMPDRFAIAGHADGSAITPDHPARPGEVIVLWVTGLGRTSPDIPYGQIATTASDVLRRDAFRVYLNGFPLPSWMVEYAGLTPNMAGLYQVNFRVPFDCPIDPEIRLGYEEPTSEPQVKIAIRPEWWIPETPDPSTSPEEPAHGSR